jgi:hypothetical protein
VLPRLPRTVGVVRLVGRYEDGYDHSLAPLTAYEVTDDPKIPLLTALFQTPEFSHIRDLPPDQRIVTPKEDAWWDQRQYEIIDGGHRHAGSPGITVTHLMWYSYH